MLSFSDFNISPRPVRSRPVTICKVSSSHPPPTPGTAYCVGFLVMTNDLWCKARFLEASKPSRLHSDLSSSLCDVIVPGSSKVQHKLYKHPDFHNYDLDLRQGQCEWRADEVEEVRRRGQTAHRQA